jgi:3-dehydroquinate dehydratase/shikimate dehydrogenase
MSLPSVHKICIPIRESRVERLEAAITASRSKAGYLELRLDYLDPSSLIVANLAKWAQLAEVPVIATFRRKMNGGEFQGSEAEQMKVIEAAIAAGLPYIDLEVETVESFLRGSVDSLKGHSARIIVSYHNFESTPEELSAIYQRLLATRPDVLKIATMAKSFGDNLRILDLIALGKKDRLPVIAVAMGELGIYSRILGPPRGALLTYGSLEEGRETAPGQLTADDLAEVYGIDDIDEETKLLGVIGYPLGHSLSPQIHNRAFRGAGVNCRYLPLPTQNLPDFASYLDRFVGFSVTIPHKVAILKWTNWLDGTVTATGAANTLVKRGNSFHAYNTDVDGVRVALRAPLEEGIQNVVLLGAGGAARAAAVVLREAGCLVTVLGRNVAKVRQFGGEFGFAFDTLDNSPKYSGDLLINATSVGMSPRVDETPIHQHSLNYRYVFDMVYNPLVTRLLQECGGKVKTISGVEMFVAQAAKQYELWTGLPAPRELMREVALHRLTVP